MIWGRAVGLWVHLVMDQVRAITWLADQVGVVQASSS